MKDLQESDIVSSIISEALKAYGEFGKEYENCAKKLKRALEEGDLNDPNWILNVLQSDLIEKKTIHDNNEDKTSRN